MKTVQITAADRTLYHVAAQYLGDATQWWRISQANGMSDPDLSDFTVPITIRIPAADASLTNGLPSQSTT